MLIKLVIGIIVLFYTVYNVWYKVIPKLDPKDIVQPWKWGNYKKVVKRVVYNGILIVLYGLVVKFI